MIGYTTEAQRLADIARLEREKAEIEAALADAKAAKVEPELPDIEGALDAYLAAAPEGSSVYYAALHAAFPALCKAYGISTQPAAPVWPGDRPQDHWTVVGAVKSARALIKAADDLSYAAQLSGGVAGRDDALCAAIVQWAAERDKQKQVLRIIELEGDSPEIGAGRLDHPLREWQQANAAPDGAYGKVHADGSRSGGQPAAPEQTPDSLHKLRADVFEVLRRHDVSEQCFAEVAMVTHAAIRAERRRARGGAS